MLCTYLALHFGLQYGMDMLGIMLGSVRVSHVQLNPMVESPCKACFATRAAPDV